MATKQPKVKGKTGTALVPWKERLATLAKDEEATIQIGEGMPIISTRGGEFTFRQTTLPEPLRVIIVDHCYENAFYEGAFDPDDRTLPDCFAVGRDVDELKPGTAAPHKQHAVCEGCPQNDFGSADTGKGKACKNGMRLLVLAAAQLKPGVVADNDLAMLRLPPTSLKHFAGYTRQLNKVMEVPTLAVVTELSLEKPEKNATYKIVKFKFGGPVPEDCLQEILDLQQKNREMVAAEYTEEQYKALAARREQGAPKRGKKPAARKPAKAAPKRQGFAR